MERQAIERELRELLADALPPGTSVDPGRPLRRYGLTSMATARLWLEIPERFGVEVPLDTLVGDGTLADLAGRIAATPRGVADPGPSTIEPDPAGPHAPFPLTPLQESYLVGADPAVTDDPVGCHQYLEIGVVGADPSRLRASWQRLVDAHDMLRAVVTGGRQRVLEQAPPWPLPVHDLTGAPPERVAAHLDGVRARLARHRFALNHPGDGPQEKLSHRPPFVIELSRCPGGTDRVHLSIDSMVTDGHGLAILLRDWAAGYHRPDPAPAPAGPPARDCVLAMLRQRDDRDLAYWLDRLADAPAGPDLGPPPRATPDRERRPFTGEIGAAQWTVLRERAAALGVSPTALLLTAFADALAGSGAAVPFSLVVTTTARTRLPASVAGVVGPFTSTAVVVPDIRPDRPVTAAAAGVQEQLHAALAHPGATAAEILRRRRGAPVAAGAPATVFTSLLDIGPDGRVDGGFAADVRYAVSETSGVLIDCQVWQRDSRLMVRWDAVPGLAPTGAVSIAFGRFLCGLAALGRNGDEPATAPLNPLQQAYFVSRARHDGATGPAEGCQIYHSFSLPGAGLDPDRLAAAVRRLIAAHAPLRSWMDGDGTVRTRSGAPDGWRVPVLDVSGLVDPSAVLDRIRDELACRAFPLGRWPQFDVRASVGRGPAKIHCGFDVALCDAPTAHFLARELVRLYADPEAGHRSFAALLANGPAAPEHPDPGAHWAARVADLPAGPVLPAPGREPVPDREHPAGPEPAREPGAPGPAGAAGPVRSRLVCRVRGWHRLVRRAAAEGVSPDALLLAAFTAALAPDAADPDFTVPYVRWNSADDERRPGEFTRLSWVRAAPRGMPLAAAAARYHAGITADRTADRVPGLDALRRRLVRERADDARGYPVVYSGVVDLTGWPLPDGIRPDRWLSCTPDVWLDCVGTAEGEWFEYAWDAAESRFAPGWLPAAFARYGRLLDSLISPEPVPPVPELPEPNPPGAGPPEPRGRLDPAGYRRVVYAWNATGRTFAADRPAHALVEDRARERPDAVAVRGRSGTMTFGELNRAANRIAWGLRERGAGRGSVVAVRIPRTPLLIASVFGVLKAGAAYLPIEPAVPDDRVAGMLRRAGAAALLTTSDTGRCGAPDGLTVVPVDREPGPGDRAGVDPPHTTGPEDLAYVMFTSGSSGAPKGVAVPHRAVSNLLSWCLRTFGFGPADLGLSVTSLGFDLSVFDLFGVLGAGGGLYLADEEQQRDPALLLDLLTREPITFWNSAPTTLAQVAPLLAGVPGESATRPLRLAFLSGDYPPLWLPDAVRAAFGRAVLVSLGGATEATVWSNYHPIGAVDPGWRSVPYGRPIDNARYYILDPALAPCPAGEEGDLYIAGPCLSRGYQGDPALTAERFVPDPFAVLPGERMYRTGDRAAHDRDGTIHFRGRADAQVKVRGYRVEPGEVEHRLRQHPAVRDAVVRAREGRGGDTVLVAYLVAAGTERPAPREVREHAARGLPEYLVPNLVTFVDALPATPNGKLDPAALPWPLPDAASYLGPDAASETASYVEPDAAPAPVAVSDARPLPAAAPSPGPPSLAELAEEIAGLFGDLLGRPPFDPREDLWDQGATSFTVIQVTNALHERYGRRVRVGAVFAEPTAATMARDLRADLAPPGAPPGPAPVPLAAAAADPRRYADRATRRSFLAEPLPADALGQLLGPLRPIAAGGRERYRYPSAGDSRAVDVYLRVRPEAVPGVAAGAYRYRPVEHDLRPVPGGGRPESGLYRRDDRSTFDGAAFELFLIGRGGRVPRRYRAHADRFLAIEAGHMGQLLMAGQADAAVGLCPIGEVDVDRLGPALALADGDRFLIGYLGGPIAPAPAEPRPVDRVVVPAGDRAADRAGGDVAIVGLAGRYPRARNLDEFWRLLADGVDCIEPFPARRRRADWPTELMWGSFLAGVDRFDPLFFGIAPRDADLMDPQERLFLEVAWETLEDAGHPPHRLRAEHGGLVGVFAATMYNDYPFFGAERSTRDEPVSTGSSVAGIANRVSHALDLRGPSLTVDSMCSSSLTAVHLAVQSLRRGECELALAGGVNLSLHPNKFVEQDRLGMAAADHRCRAFGAGGDGFAPGEGVGAVLLKPLAAAVAAGDRVHAVIRGTAVGHGGRTNGYTVPDPAAQARVITGALREAGIEPHSIGYVEAHGTGTALGDPVEIEGVERALCAPGGPDGCAIGSVKSNLGHLEGAAGIAGLTKVVLQLRHRRLVPTLHTVPPNPAIDWSRSPLRLQRVAAEWPAPVVDGVPAPRRVGVSSFGTGGTNAHVIVEEYPPPDPRPVRPADGRARLVVLSAVDEAGLRAAAARLAMHVRPEPEPGSGSGSGSEPEPGSGSAGAGGWLGAGMSLGAGAPPGAGVPLARIAYTLQVGREPLRERLAAVVADVAELARVLARFAADGDGAVLRGRAPKTPARGTEATPRPAIGAAGPDRAALAELGRSWVRGATVDWSRLYPEGRPALVGLPSYPFAGERHWLPEPGRSGVGRVALRADAWRPAPTPDGPAAPASAVPAAPASVVSVSAASVPAIVCLHTAATEPVARRLSAAAGVPVARVEIGGAGLTDPDAVVAAAVRDGLGRDRVAGGFLDLCDLYRRDGGDGWWRARMAALAALLDAGGPLRALLVVDGLHDPPGPPPNLAGARMAGLLRALDAERPGLRSAVLDTAAMDGDGDELIGQILSEWRAAEPPAAVCYREGVRLLPEPAPVPLPPAVPVLDPALTYLVTGGTGALGGVVAEHLARRGARRLALMGLRPVRPRARWDEPDLTEHEVGVVARVRDLERAGLRVALHTGPLTDRPGLAAFLGGVRSDLGALGGIVHCAGRMATVAPFTAKDPDRVAAVLAPKIEGLTTLAELCRDDPLSFLVLFSSASARLPALMPGVVEYAAANAFLDFFAAHRARTGAGPACAIGWPGWRGADMAGAGTVTGMSILDEYDGLRILDAALCGHLPASTTVTCSPEPTPQPQPSREREPQPSQEPELEPTQGPPPPDTAPVAVPDWLVRLFARTLAISPDRLDVDAEFDDLGVHSMLIAELVRGLDAHLRAPVEPSVLVRHTTLRRLAGWLGRAWTPEPRPRPAAESQPTPTTGSGPDPAGRTARRSPLPATAAPSPPGDRVAVIGLACRFPAAPDAGAFRRNLRAGHCAITEVPPSRWDVAGLYLPEPRAGRSISRWGGFVDGIEEFDPGYFGLSDEEATALDPGIRLVLESAVACLHDAGYGGDEVDGRPVGVFVGGRLSDYRLRRGPGAVGADQNFLAARVAHRFNLTGPNLVVDSACSSALVAVRLAMDGLRAGECDLALAGGVEVLLDEGPYLEFSAVRALSPSGRCRTFDEGADGFVPGEGAGLVLLKRLDRALADGDRIHAVIDAVAVGNDGRTVGVTTPNPAAQASVVRRALRACDRRAGEVGLVEAHGTGTMIGDPIELRALTEAYRDTADGSGFCAIGSVKSNVGHLLAAAGVAGLLKAVLSVEHGERAPTLFCPTPNPRFDFASSPFFPATRLLPWPEPPAARVAGVSAFGLGGTNAHAIVSGFDPGWRTTAQRRRPLPPPRFTRRRLWLDRPGAPATAAPAPSAPGTAGHGAEEPELVAALLDLDFAP